MSSRLQTDAAADNYEKGQQVSQPAALFFVLMLLDQTSCLIKRVT